ncbi:Uncharacterized protein dnm_013220 [Desulfonema magnum]|uniref:Uncharacterized protein n=1 Tax=Desulfonema magnum TaxID=45655 RepID=A0A975GL18_9BACT|nr:Uncharacterized protein dnm_013220 [Desulfonema magnum]
MGHTQKIASLCFCSFLYRKFFDLLNVRLRTRCSAEDSNP